MTDRSAPRVGGAEPVFHAIDYASPDGDYSMMVDWQEGADGRLVIVGMGRLIEAAAIPRAALAALSVKE